MVVQARVGDPFCPVVQLLNYIKVRGNAPGYLFLDVKGSVATATKGAEVLRDAVNFLGLDPKHDSIHSFRSGKATDLALDGATELQLRMVGRWESTAYGVYVKQDEIVL